MRMNPTYQAGFASTQRGRIKYPSLWRGGVGAWAPLLGQTGLVLRDHSGFGNHGTLTNGPVWGVSGGQHTISFDGTNDYVTIGNHSRHNLTDAFTISLWWRSSQATVAGKYPCLISRGTSSGGSQAGGYGVLLNGDSSNFIYAAVRDSSDYQVNATTSQAPDSKWHHFAATFVAGTSLVAYSDGVFSQSSSTATVGSISQTSRPLVIGTHYDPNPPTNGYITSSDTYGRIYAGGICDLRIYSRVLTTHEIRQLASRVGVAYERTRKSYLPFAPTFKAAWLNQRSQIIGGGVR